MNESWKNGTNSLPVAAPAKPPIRMAAPEVSKSSKAIIPTNWGSVMPIALYMPNCRVLPEKDKSQYSRKPIRHTPAEITNPRVMAPFKARRKGSFLESLTSWAVLTTETRGIFFSSMLL
ncbi:hypothetical protein D3C75_1082920 [compost metagenome]